MSRPRLHLPAGRWAERVILQPAERHHLVDVLRLKSGERLEVFDGQGAVCQATLLRESEGWLVLLSKVRRRTEERPRVWLGLALLKGRKLDEVIRMVTELGVIGVLPFTCRRSVPRPDAARGAARVERWRTIAAQAARQSGRAQVPEIATPGTLEHLLETPPPGLGVVLHERAAGESLVQLLTANPAPERLVLVGPEGGFAADELDRCQAAGLRVAGLGLPVLRAPTAAVVAAAFGCGLGWPPNRAVRQNNSLT